MSPLEDVEAADDEDEDEDKEVDLLFGFSGVHTLLPYRLFSLSLDQLRL